MTDPDVAERWLAEAFASVTAPLGVDAWRHRVARPMRRRRVRSMIARSGGSATLTSKLVEVALIAAIATGLFLAMQAAGGALFHSRSTLPTTTHSSPVAKSTASASAAATGPACSRLQAPYSIYGYQYEPPGGPSPRISCSQALAAARCPAPTSPGVHHPCFIGLQTAVLVRVSDAVLTMAEYPGGKPLFKLKNLLVWQITSVPTVCSLQGDTVTGGGGPPPLVEYLKTVASRCRVASISLLDASSGKFVQWVYYPPLG